MFCSVLETALPSVGPGFVSADPSVNIINYINMSVSGIYDNKFLRYSACTYTYLSTVDWFSPLIATAYRDR